MLEYLNSSYGHEYANITPLSSAPSCFTAQKKGGWRSKEEKVLIKTFDYAKHGSRRWCYTNEIRALQALQDAPYVCRLLHSSLSPERQIGIIVQEYMEHDDLIDLVNDQVDRKSEEYGAFVKHLFSSMIDILADLEQRLIVHCDIKLENVLYHRASKRMKVIDFEFAYFITVDPPQPIRGTPPYVDYVLMLMQAASTYPIRVRYSCFNDAWSWAISMYRMLFVGVPFDPSFDDSRISISFFNKRLLGWNFIIPVPEGDATAPSIRQCIKAMERLLQPTYALRSSYAEVQQLLQ